MRNIKFFVSVFLFLSLKAFSQDPQHWEDLIDASDTWKYIIPVSELPVNWTDPDFDDSSWLSGPGGIGYGDNDDRTTVPSGTISVFMRKSFSLADASKLISAFLYVDYDDGFVAYLNGTEIARANIGTEGVRPAFNALATNIVEPTAPSGGIPNSFPVDPAKLYASLKNGNNVLALQFHNQASTSSDLSSTSYLFAGYSNSSASYRSTPYWFATPISENSNLPLVIIDTQGGTIQNEPKIDAYIKVIDNGEGKVNNINDPATDFDGLIGIEIRGQSSQSFPKKGYGFETRNAAKEDSSVSLLGMPAESDWILSAPYSDKTLMRNPMTYFLGNELGRWQPHTKWCELYLNGNYMGIYLLDEKIKRDKKRVHIAKLNPTDISGDSVTGGYILKIDKLDGLTSAEYFRSVPLINYPNSQNYDFTYVYPKYDEIVPEQKAYIKDFLSRAETVLNGTGFKDPVNGFRKYMDEMSFIEYQIFEEFTNNVDGYRYSTFFYKDRDSNGGKLVAGPLWDFDLCYGNVDYSPPRLATNTFVYTEYRIHWWARMMLDPDYKALLKWRYSVLRNGPLNTDSIMAYLDENQAYLGTAIDRNFQRWPILDQDVWPNPEVRYTYENEMDFLKTWITNRLTWLDTQWLIALNTPAPISTEKKEFSVYPNPFADRLTLEIQPENQGDVIVDIYNLQGQKLISRSFRVDGTGVIDLELDNLTLPGGLYLMKASQAGSIILTTKVMCSGDN